MKRTKEYRLQQRNKYYKKAEEIVSSWESKFFPFSERGKKQLIDRVYQARKSCSGSCCGNPRKWFKEKTVQEKEADVLLKEQLEEIAGNFYEPRKINRTRKRKT